jgi:cobalt-zinc-cadmium efflux system outer membrane protein
VADVLTAGLRANPLIYVDSQIIPYGSFSKARPGGPTQYDLNITYPLDVTGKRRARVLVARQANRVLEAQYQDAVRLQIDNVYRGYVDVLAARDAARYARTSLAGLDRLLRVTRAQGGPNSKTRADVDRIQVLRGAAEIAIAESEGASRDAKRALAVLLSIPAAQADALELRGSIRDLAPPPPAEAELIRVALACRPDLVAYRLGVGRARADVKLARANRLSDIYLLYQPYTFQNNAPFDAKSAHSWAVGVTVPVPVFNRNQGNIRRAELNVGQTETESAALEQAVIAEVRRAASQYALSRSSVVRLERDVLPAARRVLDSSLVPYQTGEADVSAYVEAQRGHNDVVRQHRDTLVRHRRSMLDLNTAVGLRLLP